MTTVATETIDLLLIDLSSIAYPIYHLSASDPNPDATSVKTVERVRALATGRTKGVVVCCDSGRSFRADISPTYKANRTGEDRAVVHHQIDLAIETLKADGFPVWAVKGFEADDIIASATAAAMGMDDQARVTIASADKDLLQLVCDRVVARSLKDGSTIDAGAVIAKFGVRPDQMRDYLTLVGDTSDNIKGAAGIGPKTAAALLAEWASLDAIFEAMERGATPTITPARRSALAELKTYLDTTRALITLRLDAPITLDEALTERVPAGRAEPVDDLRDVFNTTPDGDVVNTTTGEVMSGNGHASDVVIDSRPPAAVASTPVASGGATTVPAAPTGGGSGSPAPASTTALVPSEVLPAPPAEWERQLEPRSLGQASNLAKAMFQSRLFSAYGTPEGVFATILAGRELGLNAMASLRAFHIVEGKPTLAADTLRALVLKSGAAEYFRCVDRTPLAATFATKRKGEDEETRLTYTIDEAQAAGASFKDGSGWKKSPADMLVARASSKLARLVYPDVVHGLYSPEEMQ